MAKRGSNGHGQSGSVIIEDSLDHRTFLIIIIAGAIVSVVLAVAVMRIATGLSWAVIIIASGSALGTVLTSLGIMLRLKAEGEAHIIMAEGVKTAAIRAARPVPTITLSPVAKLQEKERIERIGQ